MKELFNIKAITRITVYDETRSYDYEYTPERVSKPLIGEKKLIDGYYSQTPSCIYAHYSKNQILEMKHNGGRIYTISLDNILYENSHVIINFSDGYKYKKYFPTTTEAKQWVEEFKSKNTLLIDLIEIK